MMENYEKKYKEALKRAKYLKENTDSVGAKDISYTFEQIFPELKESEDEKIKRCIGMCLTDATEQRFEDFNTNFKDCLAWLEKQGEQKSIDESKPKFKVGDWITTVNDDGGIAIEKVVEFLGNKVRLIDTDGVYMLCPQGLLNHYHLWTIQDANDGDVLSIRNPFIFRGFGDKRHPNSPTAYCGINSSGTFILSWENDWWTADDAHPATKEQHDILFQKMKEAGYEWDAEKKELKKISAQSSWSEEDEKELGAIIDELKRYVMFKQYGTPLSVYDISWLEELPSRFIIQQQPKQEWSKEDKSFIEDITNVIIENYNILQSDKEKMIDWLKSIKPNHWKPSEYDISLLEEIARNIRNNVRPFCSEVSSLKDLIKNIKTL